MKFFLILRFDIFFCFICSNYSTKKTNSQTSLYHHFGEQINVITDELQEKYNQLFKQHTEFVEHQENTIQQLQQQQQHKVSFLFSF